MSQVAPNGQVRLLQNVPLDDKYEDTLWFDSPQSQANYFLSLTPVHTMYNATRIRDGVISVDVNEDVIRHCNYLMFQNMNFSDKWFYAFIKGTEYINNNMTYVTYEIDPMQTYGHQIVLLDCLVEREHTATDDIGDNIVGENLGASELVVSRQLDKLVYDNLDIVFYQSAILNEDYDPTDPSSSRWTSAPIISTDGIANGVVATRFNYIYEGEFVDSNNDGIVNYITNAINSLVSEQQSESIVGGYIIPSEMFQPWHASRYRVPSSDQWEVGTGVGEVGNVELSIANLNHDIDGYIPKNNKLFTAPYNWLYVLSTDGQVMPLQPQFIEGNVVAFNNYHNCISDPEAKFILKNYKGEVECVENYFSFGDFPQLGYAVDGYKAWLASGGNKKLELGISQVTRAEELKQSQTKFNATLSAVKDVGQVAKGALQTYNGLTSETARRGQLARGVGNIAEGTMSGISDIGNAIYTLEGSQQTIQFANENADLQRSIAKTLPSTLHGASSCNPLLGSINLGLLAEQRCVNHKIAKVIDDYFTMFGYALNEVKKPSLHNRSRYTYVKTIGCKVNGGAPTDMITKIESILNSGCRFWADHDHVRDYDYADNLPLGN